MDKFVKCIVKAGYFYVVTIIIFLLLFLFDRHALYHLTYIWDTSLGILFTNVILFCLSSFAQYHIQNDNVALSVLSVL